MLRDPEATIRELAGELRREQEAQSYEAATTQLVALFPRARELPGNGAVDVGTAEALNACLRQWGYRRGFGDGKTLLAEATTVADGRYAFAYDAADQPFTLEVFAMFRLYDRVHDARQRRNRIDCWIPAASGKRAIEHDVAVEDARLGRQPHKSPHNLRPRRCTS